MPFTKSAISLTRTVGIEPTLIVLETIVIPLYYVRTMQRAVSFRVLLKLSHLTNRTFFIYLSYAPYHLAVNSITFNYPQSVAPL